MPGFKNKYDSFQARRISWSCKTCETNHDKLKLKLKGKPTQCLYCKQPREFYYFASKSELIRFGELRLMEKAGMISDLQTQVKLPLYGVRYPSGEIITPEYYVADYVYNENGQQVIEDVKGNEKAITELSASKIKRYELQQAINIKIIIRR